MRIKLKPTIIKCRKCGSKTEEIYYHLGAIRNKCVKCGFIFKPSKNTFFGIPVDFFSPGALEPAEKLDPKKQVKEF